MEFFIYIFFLLVGVSIGYSLPRVKQKTTVKITDTNVSFENNRKQNGDTFEIFKEDILLMSGIVENDEWV